MTALRGRSLAFERLESRTLLDADPTRLLVSFQFTSDAIGQHPVQTLQLNQDFWAWVSVDDVRNNPQGVFQAYFDFSYDESLVLGNGLIEEGPEFGAFATGVIDQQRGVIDDAGGTDTDQRPPQSPGDRFLLFSAPFRTVSPGWLEFIPAQASSSTQFFDSVSPVPISDISFEGVRIEIASAGIDVTPTSGLTTTEAAGQATFDVVLTAAPTANVTIPIESSDLTEGTVSPASLVFTTANWNVAQRVTVTGANDPVVDADVAYTIITRPATSADPAYQGKDAADVSVTNQDDDTAELRVVASAQAAEDDTHGQFTITTTRQFTQAVTVNLSAGGTATGGTDYQGLPAQVVFPAMTDSFSIPVTVLTDNLVEPDETVTLTLVGTNNPRVTIAAPPNDAAIVTITDNDTAQLSIAATTQATEDGASGLFTITTTKQFTQPVSVNLNIGGTATAGTDYTALPSSVVFQAMTSTVTISVPVLPDNVVELDETVVVTLSGTSNPYVTVAAAPNNSATMTVIDNDTAQLTIAATTQAVEDGTPGLFTVTATRQFQNPVTVTLSIGGTASPGTDYSALLTSVIFPAMSDTVTISVPVLSDSLVEANETVVVTLAGTNNADVTIAAAPGNSATVTITDNDTAQLTIAATPQAAEDGTPGLFTITTTKQFQNPVIVSLGVGGTATAGADYDTLATTVTFPALGNTVTIPVTVRADDVWEQDETVVVTLSGTSNPAVTIASAPNNAATVTIADNDSPQLSITAIDPAEEDGTPGKFRLITTKQFQSPVTVTLNVGGTATTGADYSGLSTSVSFPALTDSIELPVTVLSDELVEADETVIVTIAATSDSNVRIAPSPGNSATVTITDNDTAQLSIAATTPAAEDGTPGLFTITTTKQFQNPVTVSLSAGGTATAGSDYTALPSSVVFQAMTSTVTISVPVLPDNVVEIDETIVVTLSGTNNPDVTVAAAPNNAATVTIIDNDTAQLTITATTQAAEDGTPGLFTISTTKQFQNSVTVSLSAGGTASAGTDYSALPTSVTFPALSNTVMIPVNVASDNLVETDETVVVTLTGTDNPDVTIAAAPANSATVAIIDNDTAQLSIAATTQAAEDGTHGLFTISTTRRITQPVTITLSIGGTATAGTDYQTVANTVTLPAMTDTVTIPVTVVPDTLMEPDETVIVTLTGSGNQDATIASPPNHAATVTIVDNDRPELRIEATTQAAEDGTDGLFTITTTIPLQEPVTVNLAIGGTATAGMDYTGLTTTVTFPANTDKITIPVTVLSDNLVELDETVIVTLTGTSNSLVMIAPTPNNLATVTITDEDTAELRIEATAQASENGTAGELTIFTTRQFQEPVTVNLSVAGTATGGADYIGLPATVVFPAFRDTMTIPVTAMADGLVEPDETVMVTLAGTDNPRVTITASSDTATLSIADIDTAELRIAATAQAAEDGTPGQFTITTSKRFQEPVTVSLSFGGTATEGKDYVSPGTSLTFPAMSETATISVPVLSDHLTEASETVTATLVGTSNSKVTIAPAPSNTAAVAIADNDPAGVVLTPTSGRVTTEAGGTAALTLALASEPTAEVTVVLTSSDPSEGTVPSPRLAFSPANWNIVQTVTIKGMDDSAVDGDKLYKIVTVAISGDTNYKGLDIADVSLTNADNDKATLTLTTLTAPAAEGTSGAGAQHIFKVTLTGTVEGGFGVAYSTNDDTATTANGDYVDNDGTLAFDGIDGESKTITVQVNPDGIVEPGEVLVVALGALSKLDPTAADDIAIMGSPANATIVNDDTTPIDPMTASITGMVWADTNHNGRRDASESPLPGVSVELSGKDLRGQEVEMAAMTGNDGVYRFAELPGGTYEIIETQPIAFHDGQESLGTVEGSSSGQVANDRFTDVMLGPGQQATDYHFGEWGLRARYVSRRMLFASSAPIVQVLRQTMARAEEREGSGEQAKLIRRGETVQMSRIGSKVTLTGTSGADEFKFSTASVAPAVSGGVSQHTVEVNGRKWSVGEAEIDSFLLEGGAGYDKLELNDSPGDDSLKATGDTARLANGSFSLDAATFELVRAISKAGGRDKVRKEAVDLVLQLEGPWEDEGI